VLHADYKDVTDYRYWNGSTFGTDPAAAKRMVLGGTGYDGMSGFGGIQVAWNAYLSKFVMTHTHAKQPATQFCIRTAPNPYGPWSKPAKFYVPIAANTRLGVYTGRQHSWAQEASGKSIWCTYYRGTGGFGAELRICKATFA
jgi:hypothetical protein